MALTKVQRLLKMINDVVKCKPKESREEFRKNVLQEMINNPQKHDLSQEEIEVLM